MYTCGVYYIAHKTENYVDDRHVEVRLLLTFHVHARSTLLPSGRL
jgi:hypothetical protein